METNWLSSDFKHDRIILAGDIGGTNTTLAVVGQKKSKFTVILKCAYKSQQIDGVIDPIKEVIATARQKSSALKIDLCCISAAGPVGLATFCAVMSRPLKTSTRPTEEKHSRTKGILASATIFIRFPI